MPFTMARPWKDKKTGILHLRQRTPRDLMRLKGTSVVLPLGGGARTVKIGEVVQMSLYTRDPSQAKQLHAVADAALKQFWDDHRRGVVLVSNLQAEGAYLTRAITEAPALKPSGPVGILTTADLLERWLTYHTDKKARNTLKRYRASLNSLAALVGERDVRSLTGDDLHAWAQHRRDEEGVSPRAINKNDVVAASSMFRWAMDRNGGRTLAMNPAVGVHLDEPRVSENRERTFRPDEIKAILRAALDVIPHRRDLTISNAERWCPWLAAYSGTRIAELCHLTGQDIRIEDGIPILHLRKTKTGCSRRVPLHDHLVQQGFLEFVSSWGPGPLFYNPARHREGVQIQPAEVSLRSTGGGTPGRPSLLGPG